MAKRHELYYGQSGTGKSEAARRIIERVYAETGLGAVVSIGDGSAATYEDAGLVDAGIVTIQSWEGKDWPITTLNQLAQGYKFQDPDNPQSPLIPRTPEEMAKIGVWVFEGVSVAGLYIMGDTKGGLAYRGGQGEKIGQDSPVRIVDAEVDKLGNPVKGTGPGNIYGGNPLSHFQHAQKRLLGVIERTKTLPGHFVIWTGHERSSEDKVSKEQVIGVEAAGGALTAALQRYFGNTLHFVTAEKRAKVKDEFTGRVADDLDVEYRVYTRDHISPTTLAKYKAVTRGGLTQEEMPLYLTSDIPGEAIEEFYRILKTAAVNRKAKLEALRPKEEEAAA